MKTHNLKLFNTGQVTLPKSRRQQHDTNLFLAEETQEGLLIKPIISNSENSNPETIENFISSFKKQAIKQGYSQSAIDNFIRSSKKQ